MKGINLSPEDFLEFLAEMPELANDISTFTHMKTDEIYGQIKLHIETHKYFIEEKIPVSLSLQRVVLSWYQNVFSPLVMAIEETNAEKIFPHKTKIELFLEISDHMYYLLEEKKRVVLYNYGEGKSSQDIEKLAAYVYIPFNQVCFSYLSRNAPHRWTRLSARLRLTKVYAKPKIW